MQPPQGPFPVYQGFTPALQYPGQQQQQVQVGLPLRRQMGSLHGLQQRRVCPIGALCITETH